MPVQQAGLPIVWDDALAPSFALGAGAAAPSITAFVGVTRLLTFGPGDSVDVEIQVPHDMLIPSSGNLPFKPHVHWTFVSEPVTGQTVIWEFEYVYAAGGGSLETAGTFGATTETPLTAATYTTTGDAEIRKHLITGLGDISIAVANVAPSMIFVGRLILKATSTIAAGVVGLLSFDIHYQKGPVGTVTEFV
jgi:hypothetical protein